jgi:aspartyl aminopeptidase
VSFATTDGVAHALIDFDAPIAVIPNLAIHLDRSANEGRAVNAQNHLPVLFCAEKSEPRNFEELLLARVLEEHPECGALRVLGSDLCFYDTQLPALVGLHREFIAGGRLEPLQTLS